MNTNFIQKITLGIALLLSVPVSTAQHIPETLHVYHGAECPHCHKELKWLEGVQADHPNLQVELYEVWHDPANSKKMQEHLASLGQMPQGVPTNIIGDQIIVGFDKAALSEALGIQTNDKDTKDSNTGWKKYLEYSWPAMSIVLGLIDGFNPCAMWTLFMLLSLLLVIDDKRKRWMIGLVFLITSGVIYGAALLTYLFGFQAITTLLAGNVMNWVFQAVGAIAIVAGGMSLYHAPTAGIDCSVRDADSKRNFHTKLKNILEKKHFWVVLLGIAGLAISVNAVELLCSFAIPTTFTATIVGLDLPLYQQLIAVGLYDLMYMLDDAIVFTIAMYTLNLKVFSPKITKLMHIIGGVVLLVLGLFLVFNPSLLTSL